jgi:hypothetical protein
MQVEVLEDRQLLATITVNATADDTTADATLSLREAIEVSDGTLPVASLSKQEQAQVSGAVGATNTIDFNIPKTDPGYDPATGVWTIAVGLNPLPTIGTNAAIINGYSQPGSSKNTLAHGDNAKLTIALRGPLAGFSGLTIAQQGSRIFGLDIQHFEDGVEITAGGNVQVAGCFIGTDPAGESEAGNSNGVVIENSYNLIGGPDVGDRNLISGNLGSSGIYVPDKMLNPVGIAPTGNVIENNFIGLDATGTKVLVNALEGVEDQGTGNTYGGATPGLGNVISGNGEVGIDSTGSITIEGNYIGTDATGNVALGNGPNASGGRGIVNHELLHATSITTIISNNLVSGNDDGIDVSMVTGSQSAYTIANNLIGTNAAGTSALGNVGTGLALDSVDNATVQNNVISANYEGVVLQTAISSTELQHDVFLGNFIGTDKTGTVALGNTTTGIDIDTGSGITIGGPGPGQGNVIANNLLGIVLTRGRQDQFIRNSIFDNTGEYNVPPGIVVASGANQSAVAPVLTFTPGTGSAGTLSGTLTSTPNTTYVVEVFSNPSAQAIGHVQGKTFIQDVSVKTDGTGKGTFSLTEPDAFYTATATDPNGNTSVFSNAAGVVGLAASTTTVTSSQNPSKLGQQVTFTAEVAAPEYQGTPTGTVTFFIDGQAQNPVPLTVVGGHDEAQFVTSALTAGPHTVTAAYSGDASVGSSSGSLATQNVTAPGTHSTTTMLSTSLNPSTVGQQVMFTAVVSPGPGTFAGTPTGTVTFTVDGTPQTPVPLQMVNGQEQAVFSLATLTAGSHRLTANYNGDATFAPSAVASPLVQTVTVTPHGGGPHGGQPATSPPLVTVESVQLVRNKRHRVTGILIGFSGEINAAQAQNLAEYRLVKAGKRGSFTAKHTKLIKLRAAAYNGTSDTVTLTPKKPFALTKPVQLQVSGQPPSGLDDTLGRLIDGNHSGQPGSNAVLVLPRGRTAIHALVRGPLSLVRPGYVQAPRS